MNKPTVILLAGAAMVGIAGATIAPATASTLRAAPDVSAGSGGEIIQAQAADTRIERRRWHGDWGREDRGWRGDDDWRWRDHDDDWRYRHRRSRHHQPYFYLAPQFFYGLPFYVAPPRRHHHW